MGNTYTQVGINKIYTPPSHTIPKRIVIYLYKSIYQAFSLIGNGNNAVTITGVIPCLNPYLPSSNHCLPVLKT